MNYVSLGECGHICPGKPKEVFKILSQEQMEVWHWFGACNFISIKAINDHIISDGYSQAYMKLT